ncbi:MAG: 30S ribosomal protein S16 [Spirochaetia bacterium]|nr:30S ribosomal protein S16 [Spirochaetia bacterium]
MEVKLRLQRFGTKKRPFYRIVAAANVKQRDGRFLEILGLYHPIMSEEAQVRLESEKILNWLGKGAQPTETVKKILSKDGLWKNYMIEKEKRKAEKKKTANSKKKAKKA